jgi:glutathione S-transferase
MKLYEFPPTRSLRARWALQELGVPFESELVNMMEGGNQRPSFLALNPAGKLPVLVDDDLVLTESVAIVLYLAEKFPEAGLLPAGIAARADAVRWLLFTATELEQPLWRIARHTFIYAEAERLPQEVELARRDFRDMAAVLEARLAGREYVVGDGFTVADIVCAYTLDWANEVTLLETFPNARAYMERQYRRPAAALRIRDAMAAVQAGQGAAANG